MRHLIFIFCILLSLCGFSASAQSHLEVESENFIIRYKVNSTEIDEEVLDNRENLAKISAYLRRSPRIDSIVIYSYASPEGGFLNNERLAKGRGATAKKFFLDNLPEGSNFPDSLIKIDHTPENWAGLYALVQEQYQGYDKEMVLNIITDDSVGPETKKWRLQQLDNGQTWRYILDNYMPLLRYSTWICVWVPPVTVLEDVEPIVPKDSVKSHGDVINQDVIVPELVLTSARTVHIPSEGAITHIQFSTNMDDGVAPVVSCSSENVTVMESDCGKAIVSVSANDNTEEQKYLVEVDYYGKKCFVELVQSAPKFYMAAKTNTLYDLALIPNLGAEFYLGKNFSVVATAVFSWWKNDNIFWYWRTYGADLSLRYWFGKRANEKPLTGHHVGIYGHALTYDFEAGGRGYLASKPSVGYGVEYGYSLPIAKRLNLDFNLGFGYFGGEFEEYLPIDGHYVWQVTKHRHWVGPTKMEVSLSWLLGRGNVNKGKGGKR